MLYSKLGILEGLKLFSKLENFSVNEGGNGPARNLNWNITHDDIQILEYWLKNGDFYSAFRQFHLKRKKEIINITHLLDKAGVA